MIWQLYMRKRRKASEKSNNDKNVMHYLFRLQMNSFITLFIITKSKQRDELYAL